MSVPGRTKRELLQAAFSFVRSVEANKATAAITFDHILEARIAERISMLRPGAVRPIVDSEEIDNLRTSRYDQLQRLKDDLTEWVSAVGKQYATDEEAIVALNDLGVYETELYQLDKPEGA